MGKLEDLDFKKNSLRKINNYLQNIDYKRIKENLLLKTLMAIMQFVQAYIRIYQLKLKVMLDIIVEE